MLTQLWGTFHAQINKDNINDFYLSFMQKLWHQRFEGRGLNSNAVVDLLGADTLNLPFLFSLSSFLIFPSISLKNFSSIKGEAKLLKIKNYVHIMIEWSNFFAELTLFMNLVFDQTPSVTVSDDPLLLFDVLFNRASCYFSAHLLFTRTLWLLLKIWEISFYQFCVHHFMKIEGVIFWWNLLVRLVDVYRSHQCSFGISILLWGYLIMLMSLILTLAFIRIRCLSKCAHLWMRSILMMVNFLINLFDHIFPWGGKSAFSIIIEIVQIIFIFQIDGGCIWVLSVTNFILYGIFYDRQKVWKFITQNLVDLFELNTVVYCMNGLTFNSCLSGFIL